MAYFTKCREDFSASRTVGITGTEQVENITHYVIEIRVGPYSWTVKHRYNDFFELNEKLVQEYKIDKCLLPPKKIFGNQSEAFIRKRQTELEVYLQTLFHLLARVPAPLAAFLHFQKYEIHGITHELAEELFEKGEGLLEEEKSYKMSPLQLNAVSTRLTLPEPTCDSGNAKQDLGHILDFITRLKYLKILGNHRMIGQSNMNMNQLTFELSSFKNLHSLELTCVNCSMISGIDHLKKLLKRISVNYSLNAVDEFLLLGVGRGVWQATQQEAILIPAWSSIQRANFANNNITAIDESMKLMPSVEYLDLSHNKLEDIQHLQHLSSLTYVNLSHNRFTALNSLHTKLGNIKTLVLHNNKLESLLGFSKLYSLERLDVSNNGVSQVLEVRHISGLPCLESLNLSHNPVTIVVDYRTKILELFADRAKELSLDGQKASQKELDTVAILLAIQKAKETKAQAKKCLIKKPAVDAEIRERGGTSRQPQAPNPTLPQTAVAEAAGMTGTEEEVFRQQVEAIREQGGTAWLALLNNLQAPGPGHAQPTRRSVGVAPSDSSRSMEQENNDSSSFGSTSTCSSADDVEQQGIVLPDTLPGKSDSVFTAYLQKLLPNTHSLLVMSGLSEERQREERPVNIMWCPVIRYTDPSSEVPACVFTTTENVHLLRVKTLHGRRGLPDLEHMYCFPLLNIQQIVIGYQHVFLRIEEAFVGPQGTYSLLTTSSSKTDLFLETLKAAIYRARPEAECFEAPHIMVNSETELNLKAAVNRVENLPNLVDVQIMLYMLVQATDMNNHPRQYSTHSLTLTQNYLYIIREDYVISPQPTFSIGPSVKPQFQILCSYPVGGRIAGIQMYDADTFAQGVDTLPETFMATAAMAALYPHFLGFGVKLAFELGALGQRELDVRFPSSGMRDRFLATLTQVRKELSERSPSPPKTQRAHKHKLKHHLQVASSSSSLKSNSSSRTSMSSITDSADEPLLPQEPSKGQDNLAYQETSEPKKELGTQHESSKHEVQLKGEQCESGVQCESGAQCEPVKQCEQRSQNNTQCDIQCDTQCDIQSDSLEGQSESDTQSETASETGSESKTEEREDGETVMLSPAASSISSVPQVRTRPPSSLDVSIYPTVELLDHLTKTNDNMTLLTPLSEAMMNLASMEGEELLNFFHSHIAQIASCTEELQHVMWCEVTPYHSPTLKIPTCCLLSTRAIYFLSDHNVPVKKTSTFEWKKTHHRVKSDSLLGLPRRQDQGHHHSSGILHTGATQQRRIRAYCTLELTDLKHVNLGMFDQSLRFAGTSPDTVYACITRDNLLTGLFVKHLMMVLSRTLPSPSPDLASPESDVDIYKKFGEINRLESQEYVHPSKVKFIYPSEEVVSELQYLMLDSLPGKVDQGTDMNILLYLLVYVKEGRDEDMDVSKCKCRSLIVTSSHLALAIEDHVSYPLPEFAKGLPEAPNFEMVVIRRLELLRRLVMGDFTSHDLCLVFVDESGDIMVDPSMEHYSTDDSHNLDVPEVSLRLIIQNLRDRERLIKLLRQRWPDLHGGEELSVQVSS